MSVTITPCPDCGVESSEDYDGAGLCWECCQVQRLPASVNGTPAGRRIILTAASAIMPERVRWLWQQRFPLRGLSLLAGEPGLGKSTLTVALAALITRGMLDGELSGKPRDVLIASAEDHFASVVWGRLTAAGADMGRVHHVSVEDQDGEGLLTLPDDVSAIEEHCVTLAAAGRRVALVSVDPVGAFIAGGVDTHRDSAVRRVLAPLAGLSERQDLATLGVVHLNKNEALQLINRVNGSIGFVGAARSILAFARDPGDPDGDRGSQRVIVHAKSNHGQFATTLTARVEGREIPEVGSVSRLVITGESDIGPEDLQRGRDDDGQDSEEAITAALADGPRPSRDVKGQVAAELGCSRRTVERAAARMRDRGELTIDKSGFPPTSTWAVAVSDTARVAIGDSERVANGQARTTEPDQASLSIVGDPMTDHQKRSVTLGADEFEDVRRATLDKLHEGLERTLGLVDDLRQKGVLDDGVTAADTRGSIRTLRRELDALEALGWHDNHYAKERAAI